MADVDLPTAEELVSPRGTAALALAGQQVDPGSLEAATRLRREFGPKLAAAALYQIALRRRARGKLGELSEHWLLTETGLEQATRPAVARWRSARLAAAGAPQLVDLGSGLGVDSHFAAAAGLEVQPVEHDPVTAVFAEANLGLPVTRADARQHRLPAGAAVYVDPARRGVRGRSWDLADLSPDWDFVLGLAGRTDLLSVKLGPGFPHRAIPDGAEAVWIGHGPDAVELSLWFGGDARPGRRAARLIGPAAELDRTPAVAAIGELGGLLYEPHPAAIAAGLVDTLGWTYDLRRVAERIAYLTGDAVVATPWLTGFRIIERLPYREKTLRAWARANEVGTLEIKKRGVAVDPATLRRRLRPRGAGSATVILTPSGRGTTALIAERLALDLTEC